MRDEAATHLLQQVPGGWRCLRCGLVGGPSRKAPMTRAQCPMPDRFGADGTLQQRAYPWERYHAGLWRLWRGWLCGNVAPWQLKTPWERDGSLRTNEEGQGILDLRWRNH